MNTYAIGDIHGMLTRLHALVDLCRKHADGRPSRIVFLGDYIDRGPDSRGVLEFLMQLQSAWIGETIFLRGNHEALVLDAIDNRLAERHWLRNGGLDTLKSYGVGMAEELPGRHREWLGALATQYDDGLRFFVHAGIDPARPLDQQIDNDLLWMREPFLSDERPYDRLIVHGHTPTFSGRPDQRTNRLNLDTGAAYGGPLTAAVFTSGSVMPTAFLQT